LKRFFVILILGSFVFGSQAQTYPLKKKIGGAVLAGLSGGCDAVNQTIWHHKNKFRGWFPNANPQYWDPALSWRNKYEFDAEGNIAGPAFPGSTNVLAWATDLNHATRTGKRWTGIVSLTWIIGGDRKHYKEQGKKKPFKHYVFDVGIYSGSETLFFNLFYHVL
jgi:hypothetical protein